MFDVAFGKTWSITFYWSCQFTDEALWIQGYDGYGADMNRAVE